MSKKARLSRGLYRISDLRSDFIGNDMTIDGAPGDGVCRTIAICNHKGGVGKTVTAINLSARFAARGLQTLLIDLDPQGHSGLGLGLDTDGLNCSVYDVLMNGICSAREAIVRLRPNLDILASNVDLALAELELARFKGRERRLKEVADGLKESYRYIVIDCPPSTGLLTANALVASQTVVVPVTPACLSIYDLSQVVDLVAALKNTDFSEPTIFFLLTFFEKRQREAQFHKRHLEHTHGRRLLKTLIRKNTRLNEAVRKGVSIFEYDQNCSGARDYSELATEVLSLEHGADRAAKNRLPAY